jgi:hypothetical protein
MITSGALGAGFSSVIFLWLTWSLDRHVVHWFRFVLVGSVMYLASLKFFDPLQDLLTKPFSRNQHNAAKAVDRPRWVRALLLGIGLSLVLGEDAISDLLTENPASVLLELVGAFFTVGLVTFLWIQGVRVQPPRAAWWSAVGYGLTSELVFVGIFAWSIFQHPARIDETTANAFAAYFVKNCVAGFFSWTDS